MHVGKPGVIHELNRALVLAHGAGATALLASPSETEAHGKGKDKGSAGEGGCAHCSTEPGAGGLRAAGLGLLGLLGLAGLRRRRSAR